MKKFLCIIFRLFSFLYPYKLNQKLIQYKNIIYTLWIKNFMGHVGEHTIICYESFVAGGAEKRISIGNNTIIGKNTTLSCWAKHGETEFPNSSISIGNNCNIGEYSHITAINRISLGDGLLTGRYVIISDNAHGGLSFDESVIEPDKRKLQSKGEIVIGSNVWLGDKVAVLAGVHIGNNVIVGANSVVTNDIPDNCMVAGIPATIKKQL